MSSGEEGRVVSPTSNPQPGCSFWSDVSLPTCPAWVTLPGAEAPTGLALGINNTHKPPHYDKITMSDIKEETVYGGCEGPGSMYVKLISSDGHEFIIKREYIASSIICAMLSGCGQSTENETSEVNLRGISSRVLQTICQFFLYKVRYYTNGFAEVPDFPTESEILVDLLHAAHFLKC